VQLLQGSRWSLPLFSWAAHREARGRSYMRSQLPV